MNRSDVGKVLYAAGILICGWLTYEMYLAGDDMGAQVRYVYLMAAVVASMVVLLIVSMVHKGLVDRSRVPVILTVASGPKKDMMRSRGIIGKMPPMFR